MCDVIGVRVGAVMKSPSALARLKMSLGAFKTQALADAVQVVERGFGLIVTPLPAVAIASGSNQANVAVNQQQVVGGQGDGKSEDTNGAASEEGAEKDKKDQPPAAEDGQPDEKGGDAKGAASNEGEGKGKGKGEKV